MTDTRIHPTAVVDSGARLGAGVSIGPLAVVGADVTLGDGCVVGAHAVLDGPTVLGRDNQIHSGACIGFEPQDLKYDGEETRLEIGDGNHFREHVTVHRGTGKGGGVTRIGSRNLFMVGAHVAHDCIVGDHTIFANQGTLAGHVTVEDHAVVGAFSSVHQFCRVGRHAYIGGYSVITRDALPFVKTLGAKPVCYGLNRIGLERKGFAPETLRALERAYRIVVRSGFKLSHALERLREELDGPLGDGAPSDGRGKLDDAREHVEALIAFIDASERGVITDVPGRKSSRRGG